MNLISFMNQPRSHIEGELICCRYADVQILRGERGSGGREGKTYKRDEETKLKTDRRINVTNGAFISLRMSKLQVNEFHYYPYVLGGRGLRL